MDNMFDNHSFNDEITNASEAKSSYDYYTHNLTAFRHELIDHGYSYEEVENRIRQCWLNLLKSCQRVGYTNGHLERIAKAYSASNKKETNKNALPK